jgi:hypothetical protein
VDPWTALEAAPVQPMSVVASRILLLLLAQRTVMLTLNPLVVDLVLSIARLVLLPAARLVAQLVLHQDKHKEHWLLRSALLLILRLLVRLHLAPRSSAEALTGKVQGHSVPVLILPGHLDQPAAGDPVVEQSASRELEAHLPSIFQIQLMPKASLEWWLVLVQLPGVVQEVALVAAQAPELTALEKLEHLDPERRQAMRLVGDRQS